MSAIGRVCLEISHLQAAKTPVEKEVGGYPAFHLGLGDSGPDNLGLRKAHGLPGAPFGGLGFFDPQAADKDGPPVPPPPADLTKEKVREIKLCEFRRCARSIRTSSSVQQGFYFWALQPIWDTRNRAAKAAEILVRARNGADSAPFEDVQALMDVGALPSVREVFNEWKATEIVDWPLGMLKKHPELCQLESISSNMRPSDLSPTGDMFREVTRRLALLDTEDRRLLLKYLVIEVVEDEEAPPDLAHYLEVWRELGFRLSYDDTIGDLACEALQKRGLNFHTTTALMPLLTHFMTVKVDIEWPGFALFLSHPAYAGRQTVKEEVLAHARDHDLVYVPSGRGLRNTHASYSNLLAEFAQWAHEMIRLGKSICIELSVTPEDKSNAFALQRLKELGVDIFGANKASFQCQGGPTGAKAFLPQDLVAASRSL